MQYLLQPKRSDAVAQTTETVERWECDVRENEWKFDRELDEDVKIDDIFALAPPSVLHQCHLTSHIPKSYAQFRTMLFDCCRAPADTAVGDAVPMELSVG